MTPLKNVLILMCCTLCLCTLSEDQKQETLHKLEELINDEMLESLHNVMKTNDLTKQETKEDLNEPTKVGEKKDDVPITKVNEKKETVKTSITDNANAKSVEDDAQVVEANEKKTEGYTCADHETLGGQNCKNWKKFGLCKEKAFRAQMRKYCQKTCDLCKPPAPPIPEIPACALTEFGCCWDKKTAAVGKNQEGCLPCKDKYKFLCNNFASDCSSKLEKGLFMRISCPETCQVDCESNLNVHKCKDDKANQQNCIDWARDGACNKAPEKMRAYCKYTCGFCTGPPRAIGG